jgi:NTP pyrophosphatase (non-canonical NTP hydrolase)
MKTIVNYIEGTATTAVYPGVGGFVGLTYVLHGLIGEAGELSNKFKKMLRDGNREQLRDQMVDELGDVLWYAARLAVELGGLSSSSTFTIPVRDMKRSAHLAIMDDGIHIPFISFALLQLHKAVASINDLCEEKYGDHDPTYTMEAKDPMIELFWTLHDVAYVLGADLDTVGAKNLAKLTSRKDRGKLQGAGDDR